MRAAEAVVVGRRGRVRSGWRVAAFGAALALGLAACDWGDIDGIPGGFADGVDNDTQLIEGPGVSVTGGVIEADFDDTDSHSGSSDLVARGDHDHDDDYVLKAGDTMTGALVLNADPAADLEAATRQYVDAAVSGVGGGTIDGVSNPGGDIDLVEGANIGIIPDDAGDQIFIGVLQGASSGLDADTVDGAHLGDLWQLGGNAGTTPGTDFVGTSDDQPLELRVNGARALRLVPETNGPAILGGHPGNYIEPGAAGATVSGGGATAEPNRVYDSFGTVGGGRWNQAGDDDGGTGTQMYATVGGGYGNYARNVGATVAGGITNFADGNFASVPGGHENAAAGDYSFAAGRQAQANHAGSFVWADSTDANFASTAPDQFLVRAAGGVGIGTTTPATALDVNGIVTATAFSGSGASLTNVDADTVETKHAADLWQLGGNALTDPTTEFIGATGSALEIHAGTRVLRFEPESGTYGPAVIAGSGANDAILGGTVAGGGSTAPGGANSVVQLYGTIGGGWGNQVGGWEHAPYGTVSGGQNNFATAEACTVGGGRDNVAGNLNCQEECATVGGGWSNAAHGAWSAVGGGSHNTASNVSATVGGGQSNTASGQWSTVGGGAANIASGDFAATPGGNQNTASGDYSLAAGRRAQAAHAGAFVWADSTDANFASAAANELAARATGGVRIVTGLGAGATGSSVAGHEANSVTTGATACVIAGGGASGGESNQATDELGTVSGGAGNIAGDGDAATANSRYATVGGGYFNQAGSEGATVSGGQGNDAMGGWSSVGGGYVNWAYGSYATIGGGAWNGTHADYATIGGGGGDMVDGNHVYDDHGTIGGGFDNVAGDSNGDATAEQAATVGGGQHNTAGAYNATVAGGGGNQATGAGASIGGGELNTASALFSTIPGGGSNTASGTCSTVPGGASNTASGEYSLAAGQQAKAIHDGAFVWADSTDADFESTGADQFLIRASGGVGIGTASPTEQVTVSGSAEVTASVKSPVLEALAGDGTTVTIRTNAAAAVSGGVTISTGDTAANGGTTGSIVLQTGHENGSGQHCDGGQIELYGYANFNAGGAASMRAGDGWASAGAVTIRGGNAGSGKGGDLTLKGGNGGAGLGGAGNVIIDSGSGGSQAPGFVSLRVAGTERMRVHSDGNVGINTATPGSALTVGGPIATATVSVSADTALDDSVGACFVDASALPVTVTLPAASSATVGRVYWVYKVDAGANAVTVAGSGADTVNGTASTSTQWQAIRVIGHAPASWIATAF